MKTFGSMILTLAFLFSYSASALVEVRLGYSLQHTSGVTDNDANVPNMKTPAGLNVDVLTNLFLLAGIRYESLSEDKSTGLDTGYETTYTRTSLVAGYRFINTDEYFLGPIATIGLASKLNYTYNPLNGPTVGMSSGNNGSYSVGVEGGFQAFGYLVGAEIGYLSAKIGNLKSKDTGSEVLVGNQAISADMSGLYTRIMAGFSF